MEYHFDQNQGFSPKGISYEQPLTLKQVARPSIFGNPDFFLEEVGARYFNTRDFFAGEGQVILIPILKGLVHDNAHV